MTSERNNLRSKNVCYTEKPFRRSQRSAPRFRRSARPPRRVRRDLGASWRQGERATAATAAVCSDRRRHRRPISAGTCVAADDDTDGKIISDAWLPPSSGLRARRARRQLCSLCRRRRSRVDRPFGLCRTGSSIAGCQRQRRAARISEHITR